MRTKANRVWPFYGVSLLAHLLLILVLSLLPQGMGRTPFKGSGCKGVYRVRFLDSGHGSNRSSHGPAGVAPEARAERIYTRSVKEAGKPVRLRGVAKTRLTRRNTRMAQGDVPLKVARSRPHAGGEAGRSGPKSREPRPDPSISVLEGPGYGEEALLAAIASGPGMGKPGPGEEGKKGTGGIIPPLPVVKEKPPYPQLARRRGYEGRLVLRLLVSSRGRVERVVLVKSSGYSILDRVAVKTLKRWRFYPARRGRCPIPYWVEVPVVFDLRRGRG